MTARHSNRGKTEPEPAQTPEPVQRRARRTADLPIKDLYPQAGQPPREGQDEVRSVVMHLAQRVDELTGQLDQARRHVVELQSMTDEDALLPVLNRRGFFRELSRSIAFIGRYETVASLLYIDIDGLKGLNERYGRVAGDTVLTTIASRIARQIRASDVVGRLDGDAFGVILWTADHADASRKADLLARRVCEEAVVVDGLRLDTRLTAGATGLTANDAAERALARAEAAMRGATR